MQAAARRLVPIARQQLAHPHRLGLRPNIHLRLRSTSRCFASISQHLRNYNDSLSRQTSICAPLISQSGNNEPNEPREKEVAEATAPPVDQVQAREPAITQEEIVEELSTSAYGGAGDGNGGDRPTRSRGRPTGSKSRRLAVKARELPKPVIPEWFMEKSVMLREDSKSTVENRLLGIYSAKIPPPEPSNLHSEEQENAEPPVSRPPGGKREKKLVNIVEPEASGSEAEPPAIDSIPTPLSGQMVASNTLQSEASTSETTLPSGSSGEPAEGKEDAKDASTTLPSQSGSVMERYKLHTAVWNEIKAHVQTGFVLPGTPFADSFASMKSHYVLRFPKEGGVYFLDAVVEKLAADLDTDLIRMDAQDFAEIAGDYLGDSRHGASLDLSSFNIRSLGYDTQLKVARGRAFTDTEEEAYDEDSEEAYDDEEEMEETQSPTMIPLPQALSQLFRQGRATTAVFPFSNGSNRVLAVEERKDLAIQRLNEKKLETLLDVMISAGQVKRLGRKGKVVPGDSEANSENSEEDLLAHKTLLHIRDYRELERTPSGKRLLRMLHDLVQTRRLEGEQIVILGSSSAEEPLYTFSKHGLNSLQSYPEDSLERTILVPPINGLTENSIFKDDARARIREVNFRHLQDVIRRRSGGASVTLNIPPGEHHKSIPDLEPVYENMDPTDLESVKRILPVEPENMLEQIPGISEKAWDFDRVHRVGSIALSASTSHEITPADIKSAVEMLDQSDSMKLAWAAEERKIESAKQDERNANKPKSKIPKNLTPHEKKLVGGVIDPGNIHTRFSSVRASPETIETMKTLTSMSLIRPEAFKYGVLAKDRIPGVLLYGPPGTGKTLLAKAVAKESGATVLEVAGSEIFDMYVGEGEKNVKAIFSLAKKLSPCVIFIDEADAIFGSRQSHSHRSTHREVINQFLKEWADLSTTAFIMVATNRPFDLDDAVLRRLPRRILIDLPTRDDRLAILKIHLGPEELSPSVDLGAIADKTPLYSGSDLKNICVSAALACVREENALFEKTGTYPEKRVLEQRHFEKALNEVAASISDDMGSLTAIRKFDEKYGEGSGRKKSKKSLGFGLGAGADEVSKDAGRVRA